MLVRIFAGLVALGRAQLAGECIAFGPNGAAEVRGCESPGALAEFAQTRGPRFGALWALEAGGSLALLNGVGDESSVRLWNGNELSEVSLGSLTSPVGAAYLDGLLYVACFGTGQGDNGLAVIDVQQRRMVAEHVYPEKEMYVHNAFAFEFQGQKEIFVAILGNPWSLPPVAGRGLVRFDRTRQEFDLSATQQLNARSAKQQADGSVFVLTQEPPNEASILARLEEINGALQLVAATTLPERQFGGEGGADVILGVEPNTVWTTDRQADAPGQLHFYKYENGAFDKLATRDVGVRPRYATVLANGDIISCNQDGDDLSVYPGLALNPLSDVPEVRVPALSSPTFFVQTSVSAATVLV